MNIWLIKIGEPLPIDPGSQRLLRIGLLSEELSQRDHQITYWTSTINWRSKKNRFQENTWVDVKPNYRLRLAYAPEFERSLSIGRVRHNQILNKQLEQDLREQTRPDIIFCCYPTIETALTAVRFGKRHGIPVVLDIRDLWPDVIRLRFSGAKRMLFSPMFAIWEKQAREALGGATAITGITDEMVDWAVNLAGRQRRPMDRQFSFGFPNPNLTQEELDAGAKKLEEVGMAEDENVFTACYLGQLTGTVEFETVVAAFKQLHADGLPFRLCVCGAGDHEDAFRAMAAGVPNIRFGGWVGKAEAWLLMNRSQVGMFCYHSTFDYESNIPNKIPEYLAASLPILSSIEKGVPKNFLESKQCGFTYQNGKPETLVAHLKRLHEDRAALKQASDNAYNIFDKQFRAEVVYNNMANYVEEIVRQNAKAGN